MERKAIARICIFVALLLCVAALAGPMLAGPARAAPSAATFVVDSVNDEYDVTPGDGQCTGHATGKCTLRAAVMEANALAGTDTINLQASAVYTLTRASVAGDETGLNGDLDIADHVTINGQDSVIAAGNPLADRLVEVRPAVRAQLAYVTIRGGNPSNDGGGIRNAGALTLTGAILFGNASPGNGGAIAAVNGSTTMLINSRLTGNQAVSGGAMAFAFGAIGTLENTTVFSNSASFGGGVYNNDGIVAVRHSTVAANVAQYSGGGVYNALGSIRLVNTTVSGNRANEFGGGVYNISASADLFNVTVAFNEADSDNAGVGSGGGIYTSAGTFKFRNTIIARNRLERGIFDMAEDCAGDPLTYGYNMIEAVTCTVVPGTGDQFGVNPLLGSLADNAGPTRTHALTVGSPAIDAANPGGCEDSNGSLLATDQRGFNRTVNGDGLFGARCDIGAFEYQILTRVLLPLIVR